MDLTDHQREALKFATEDWQDNGDGAFVDLLGELATRDTELGALILDYIRDSRALAEGGEFIVDEPVQDEEWEPFAQPERGWEDDESARDREV